MQGTRQNAKIMDIFSKVEKLGHVICMLRCGVSKIVFARNIYPAIFTAYKKATYILTFQNVKGFFFVKKYEEYAHKKFM